MHLSLFCSFVKNICTLWLLYYSWLDKLTSYSNSVVQWFHRRLWAPLVVYWRKYTESYGGKQILTCSMFLLSPTTFFHLLHFAALRDAQVQYDVTFVWREITRLTRRAIRDARVHYYYSLLERYMKHVFVAGLVTGDFLT